MDEKPKKISLKWNKDTFFIMVLVGILLFIIALPMDHKKVSTKNTKEVTENMVNTGNDTQDAEALYESEERQYVKTLEKELEQTLQCMEGVGKVKVMITVKSSSEKVVEKDLNTSRSGTTENDAQGMNRSLNEMNNESITIYEEGENGEQSPYVVKQILPNIEGIMVVAQGGGSLSVNKNITEAIQALFGVEVHRIKVVKMKS